MTLQSSHELPMECETVRREVGDLIAMHTYMRPHESATEAEFIARYLEPLGMSVDAMGNHIVQIGDAPIMWSCHTDTVHKEEGRQTVHVANVVIPAKEGGKTWNDRFMRLSKKSRKTSSCLGADDTAGVWLMREMILAKKPGLYIFHRGEEIGGIGSRHIADKTPTLVAGIQAAIALDRMNYSDVITHQFGTRTASDDFARSIADQLRLGYKPCDSGIYTDTAEYAELIPECTNLSVGYFSQHSNSEALNLDHLLDLRDSLLELDYQKLVIKRDPEAAKHEWTDDYGSIYSRNGKTFHSGGWSSEYWDADNGYPTQATLGDIIAENPDAVADWLEHLGYTAQEVIEAIYERDAA